MAAKYDWGDGHGRVHSISLAQHAQNMGGGAAPAQQAQQQTEAAGGGPPVDPNLEAQRVAAQRTLQLGDAWDAYATSQAQSEYGFDAGGNIDPSNPYSRAMHAQTLYNRGNEDRNLGYGRNTEDLSRQLGITQRSNTINMASAGQQNAGSLVNAQQFAQENADRTQGRMTQDYTTDKTRGSEDYGFASNELKQQLSGVLGGILKGKTERYGAVGANVDDATLQSILKALGR